MLKRESKNSGEVFEAFVEMVDDGCCVLAANCEGTAGGSSFELLYANSSFQEFAAARDVSPEDIGALLQGSPWTELVVGVAATGQTTRACLALEPDGWVEVLVFALPQGAVGLRLRDITEHRGMVERLIGLRRITTVGVISWGPSFGLVDVNEGFQRMTGFSHDECIGKTWQELTPAEHHPASWRAVHQVSTLGEAVPYEKEYFAKDGARWWGLFAPRKIGDEVIEFVLDVTQRRQAEAALSAYSGERDRRFRRIVTVLTA